MLIPVDIDDAYVPILENKHGDIGLWLKGLAESHFVNANRNAARAGIVQLLGKDDTFTKAVADLVRANPEFKDKNEKPSDPVAETVPLTVIVTQEPVE